MLTSAQVRLAPFKAYFSYISRLRVATDLSDSTGKSWRHLDGNPKLRAHEQVVPVIWGVPMYTVSSDKSQVGFFATGADGIALSADGEELYLSVISGRYLYSIPTARLRDTGFTSKVMAEGSLVTRAEKGISDGMESDTNGFIYAGDSERYSISLYNPHNGTMTPFLYDTRINWVDTRKSCGFLSLLLPTSQHAYQ